MLRKANNQNAKYDSASILETLIVAMTDRFGNINH